ncbi:DUF2505 domain-containing protein [Actinokineospora sp. NPDC004072]
MASRIEHHADLAAPAAQVRAALVSTEYLRDRLAELGGPGAALVEHTATGAAVSYRLRQTVPAAKLPSFTKSVFRGDLVVERAETWEATTGTTSARVAGVPGEITATYTLTDTDTGCTWRTVGRVQVRIPLIGGKVEGVIAEQVGRLLAAEAAFTAGWLAAR